MGRRAEADQHLDSAIRMWVDADPELKAEIKAK
jgi:hypothetical protein